ncbi:MAG: hypothetical protein ACK41T_03690 [Pseudobdellovibrio sp.]
MNKINELQDHYHFIRWLNGLKRIDYIKGGVGVYANFRNKKELPPSSHLTAELIHNDVSLRHDFEAKTLSTALLIQKLPDIPSLPFPLNHKANSAKYDRLAKLWSEWKSNSYAICNSVYVRGSHIVDLGLTQYNLTQLIKNEFKEHQDCW